MRKGSVRLDGDKAEASSRVRSGSELSFPEISAAAATDFRTAEAAGGGRHRGGTAAPLRVVFENEHILVAFKNAGTVTHGKGGLDEAVLEYLDGKLPPSLSFRPGPLHRLDRGTSGLVTFSKSLYGARVFSSAMADRKIGKLYLAVLEGGMEGAEEWHDDLERDEGNRTTSISDSGGRGVPAFTRAMPLARDSGTTLALLSLGTGRTHQIRVQAASRGKPLLGDVKYGGAYLDGGFLLHAYELARGQEPSALSDFLPVDLTAPPPERFLDFVGRRYGARWFRSFSEGLPSARILDAII